MGCAVRTLLALGHRWQTQGPRATSSAPPCSIWPGTIRPFEGNYDANVAPGENEFDTPALGSNPVVGNPCLHRAHGRHTWTSDCAEGWRPNPHAVQLCMYRYRVSDPVKKNKPFGGETHRFLFVRVCLPNRFYLGKERKKPITSTYCMCVLGCQQKKKKS